jgi:hypothetical protein
VPIARFRALQGTPVARVASPASARVEPGESRRRCVHFGSILAIAVSTCLTAACTASSSQPTRPLASTVPTPNRRVVGGIALEQAPAVVAEQCQHAANAVGYPVPCPRLLPFETRPYPPGPFVHHGIGPSRKSIFGSMAFPAAGTDLAVPFTSEGHLVISAEPTGTNLRHLLYGPEPDPRYDHVVREGAARVLGVRGEFVRVLATNTESIFLDHLIIVWSSGAHLYAVGFHRVNQASRALDLAVARSVVLVPPVN